MGGLQDVGIDRDLKSQQPAIHAQVLGPTKNVVFLGKVNALDEDRIRSLSAEDQQTVTTIKYPHKKAAFTQVAVLPTFMLLCYLVIFFHFKRQGGYKPVTIGTERSES